MWINNLALSKRCWQAKPVKKILIYCFKNYLYIKIEKNSYYKIVLGDIFNGRTLKYLVDQMWDKKIHWITII